VQYISQKKLMQMFQNTTANFDQLESDGLIPQRERYRSGAVFQKGWKTSDIPKIAEQIGFFKKQDQCQVATIFTTKGGVLKTTLALNLARTAAQHNLKTLVIGLDIQCDISNALGVELQFDDKTNLEDAFKAAEKTKGLSSYFNNQAELNEIITGTDLENLYLIPETPELAALNESLGNINRREYWLKDRVIGNLKSVFDLIILDCSPNWNKLTTNALVASDLLISPLECKINNFRNFKVFKRFIDEFKKDMMIDFKSIFVPTKFGQNRKLSMDIKNWYEENLEDCIHGGISESVVSEESMALRLSLLEHKPSNKLAKDMAFVLKEISNKFSENNELNTENQMYQSNLFNKESHPQEMGRI
jgi:chromosome partitioning protein